MLLLAFLIYLCFRASIVYWLITHSFLPLTVPEYGRVILKSTVPRETLLTLHHLKAICQLDERLRALPEFQPICETWSPGRCCPSWSLPNYVALLFNRTSCHHITVSSCTSANPWECVCKCIYLVLVHRTWTIPLWFCLYINSFFLSVISHSVPWCFFFSFHSKHLHFCGKNVFIA